MCVVGGGLNIEVSFYQYRDYHYKDKTVVRPSYLYNVNHHIWKDPLYIKTGARCRILLLQISNRPSPFNTNRNNRPENVQLSLNLLNFSWKADYSWPIFNAVTYSYKLRDLGHLDKSFTKLCSQNAPFAFCSNPDIMEQFYFVISDKA